MGLYTKKPITIEAVQVTAADWNGLTFDGSPFTEMPGWLQAAMADDILTPVSADRDYALWDITTAEGVMRAEPGDWIIQGVEGEIYPCKASVFQATYSEARASDVIGRAGEALPAAGRSPQTTAAVEAA